MGRSLAGRGTERLTSLVVLLGPLISGRPTGKTDGRTASTDPSSCIIRAYQMCASWSADSLTVHSSLSLFLTLSPGAGVGRGGGIREQRLVVRAHTTDPEPAACG